MRFWLKAADGGAPGEARIPRVGGGGGRVGGCGEGGGKFSIILFFCVLHPFPRGLCQGLRGLPGCHSFRSPVASPTPYCWTMRRPLLSMWNVKACLLSNYSNMWEDGGPCFATTFWSSGQARMRTEMRIKDQARRASVFRTQGLLLQSSSGGGGRTLWLSPQQWGLSLWEPPSDQRSGEAAWKLVYEFTKSALPLHELPTVHPQGSRCALPGGYLHDSKTSSPSKSPSVWLVESKQASAWGLLHAPLTGLPDDSSQKRDLKVTS